MPQYFLAVNHDEASQATMAAMTLEDMQPMFEAVGAFNAELQEAGAWVFAGGLQDTRSSTVVDATGESAVVTDGPFSEAKEYLGGFWIIEAADLEAALDWATRGSKACDGPVEVRPFQDEPAEPPVEAIERVYREEFGRVVASLTRRFGSIDLAEDAAGEALLVALERWPIDGVPANPGGWLTTTAVRRAIDRLRRESHRDAKHRAAHMLEDDTPHEPTGPVDDDRLRMVFTCCHPALAAEARVALTLRLLGGLTVAEIARAFLVPETTMAQRITRAKGKIAGAGIPFRVPGPDDLPERTSTVLAVIYLIFNEGYLSTSLGTSVRDDLTAEAIRLARILHGLLPDLPEVTGLLALMLLTEARRPARIAADGALVPLPEQDRGSWSTPLIAEGHALVRECLATNRPGRYQLMAAVSAVHTDARAAADTDWSQIAALYDRLAVVDPSPIVELNRAVALAELDGPEVGLALVERLTPALSGYHPFHATRADLLRRLGRSAEARSAYDVALALIDNPAGTAYLARRRDQLGALQLGGIDVNSTL